MRYCIIENGAIMNTILVAEGTDYPVPAGCSLLPEADAVAQYPYAAPIAPVPTLEELQAQLDALQALIQAQAGGN
jgi:hypothetical protein